MRDFLTPSVTKGVLGTGNCSTRLSGVQMRECNVMKSENRRAVVTNAVPITEVEMTYSV